MSKFCFIRVGLTDLAIGITDLVMPSQDNLRRTGLILPSNALKCCFFNELPSSQWAPAFSNNPKTGVVLTQIVLL